MKLGRPISFPHSKKTLTALLTKEVSAAKVARILGCHIQSLLNAVRRFDIPYREMDKRGENNPAWQGGVVLDKQGYRLVYSPEHPFRTQHNRVREHRLVMEKKLGRYLLPKEVVHHLDGNPQNNTVENLVLFSSNADHLKVDLKGKIPKWTRKGKLNMRLGILRGYLRRKCRISEASHAFLEKHDPSYRRQPART